MNFDGFNFDSDTRRTLSLLVSANRLPHAVIIESRSAQKALEVATYLSAFAVCGSGEKPCGACKQCKNAFARAHCDIQYVKPDSKSKTGIYNIDQIRALAGDAQIRPNERIYFFLLCQSAKALLGTIRSRCTVIRTGGDALPSEDALESAKAIARGILSSREYELLRALNDLTDKEKQADILLGVKLLLRDALAVLSGGDALTDSETARLLAARLTRAKLIGMIELTDSSDYKLKQNININLLTTWLCGEYRRILWQR